MKNAYLDRTPTKGTIMFKFLKGFLFGLLVAWTTLVTGILISEFEQDRAKETEEKRQKAADNIFPQK